MKKMILLAAPLVLACSATLAGETPPDAHPTLSSPAVKPALQAINGKDMLDHIKMLASDDFEGRSPGTQGEEKTVAYIRQQFEKMGLAPGNPNGTYVQDVPMIGERSKPALTFHTPKGAQTLQFPDQFVAWSYVTKPEVDVKNSELVFVGYGVVAPEYGWDDYKGMDLHGKTLVMLINDPPIPDPKHPGKLDPNMFKGEAMTYYGRWTYKYEMAAKLGAAAAIIVHETKPAAYPYEVVRNSNSGENFALKTDGPVPGFPPVSGWMQRDRAVQLFRASGLDFEAMKKAALSKDFKPVALGSTVTLDVKNSWREVNSKNVVAKIEGSDPQLKNEVVVYSAHWDHFGMDDSLPGPKTNKIYHGALDNASGVATLLELAKAFKALPQPPKRTVLFVATTAEERGLLGAEYYARHPLYPLQKTLADINIDGINPWGRTKDVEISGYGKSTMDDIVSKVAQEQGRKAYPESRPELGGFYRADHFEFAKVGVPVVYAKSRNNYVGKPAGYAREKVDEYIAHDYHKVSDTVRNDWDLSGAVEDTQLLFMTGYDVAQGKDYPQWKPGSEFKAARDAMMQGEHH